jgi:hypothetical protein
VRDRVAHSENLRLGDPCLPDLTCDAAHLCCLLLSPGHHHIAG